MGRKSLRRQRKESERGWHRYLDEVERQYRKRKQIAAIYKAKEKEKKKYSPSGAKYIHEVHHTPNIQYLISQVNAFAKDYTDRKGGYFFIPENFSLADNPGESFGFLKVLLNTLIRDTADHVTIDYSKCTHIDLDASICMDIILMDYISYINTCRQFRKHLRLQRIMPVHYERKEVEKVLFSIGAFRNLGGLKVEFPDITPYHLCIGNKNKKEDPIVLASKKEIDITNLVDYIIESLSKMKRTLSAEAISNFAQIIGEVLINAEEHSTTQYRYSIGYMQEYSQEEEHYGLFNLVIMNFGETIYEKFKSKECPNDAVVKRMKELSSSYSFKNLFDKSLNEEILWTLYALQEGVTSYANWKRGNGSIRFIESFFNLKGENTINDEVSRLTILSGHARITFDGTYEIIEKTREGNKFKIMAFNNNGDIEQKPDKKCVTFVNNYFPGTLINAKILITEAFTEANENGTHNNN